LSPKIIKSGSFDTSKIKKFDSELSPKKIAPNDFQGTAATPKFEKNVHHADKVAIFEDAQVQAKELLTKARNDALTEADRIKKEAFKKGYQDGMSKVENEAKVYVDEAVKSFSSLINEITEYKKALIKSAEKQLVKLAVEIADKIISMRTAEDDEIVVNVTKNAIKNLIDRESLNIRMNPKDVEVMKNAKAKIMQEVDGVKKMTIIEDESIKRGGVFIETETAEVDARIDKQLDIIQKTLERKQ